MNIPTDLEQLTALFEKLGAQEPRGWARSQIREGIPQLQRFLFLRQAWRQVRSEGDTKWIPAYITEYERDPHAPYAGVGAALKRCLAAGVAPEDLTDIVRGLQAEFLFSLCYMLEDPNFDEEELSELSWGLFQTDANDNPLPVRIGSLHESVLETDPTGREMRPREGDA